MNEKVESATVFDSNAIRAQKNAAERQDSTVTRAARERLSDHRAFLLWFTGLSGAGKTTLAGAVEKSLHKQGYRTYILDGDNVRHGLCSDLGYTEQDRKENIRRAGELAKLFVDAGVITLAAFISPFAADRQKIRDMFEDYDYIEIYCRASLSICEQRDVKGLYKKARNGEIENFTGISSPYEEPQAPDLVVNTGEASLGVCVNRVLDSLQMRGYLELLKRYR